MLFSFVVVYGMVRQRPSQLRNCPWWEKAARQVLCSLHQRIIPARAWTVTVECRARVILPFFGR